MPIIETARNARCLRISQPSVTCLYQRNAWLDTVTLRRWFTEIFFIHWTTDISESGSGHGKMRSLLNGLGGPSRVDSTFHATTQL